MRRILVITFFCISVVGLSAKAETDLKQQEETAVCQNAILDDSNYPLSALYPLPTPPPIGRPTFAFNKGRNELVELSSTGTRVIGRDETIKLQGKSCETDRKLKLGNFLVDRLLNRARSIPAFKRATGSDAGLTKQMNNILDSCSSVYPEIASSAAAIRAAAGVPSGPNTNAIQKSKPSQ